MKRYFCLLGLAIGLGSTACQTSKSATATTSGTDANPSIVGSNNVGQSYYDNARRTVAPFVVLEVSTDAEYGFTQKKPICVGGTKDNKGVENEQRYLNALRGPQGEEVSYKRRGSCCPFKTPNGMIENMGMLDAYELTWKGNAKPQLIYINFYDDGPLKAPMGFTVFKP